MRNLAPGATLSEEERAEIANIAATGADFIWVGLSTPKQETWITQAAQLLPHGVCFGVGAAFDFHTGRVRQGAALDAAKWVGVVPQAAIGPEKAVAALYHPGAEVRSPQRGRGTKPCSNPGAPKTLQISRGDNGG